MKHTIRTIILSIVMLLPWSLSFATTHHVPADYSTIQAGLDVSVSGDTVLVQPGIYVENVVWPIVDGIKLISAGDMYGTIIDANQTGRGITISSESEIDTTTLVHGFTIRNGLAEEGGFPQYNGGGIACIESSPTISSCTITGNSAQIYGGGIFAYRGWPDRECNPIIRDCIITENSAPHGGGGVYFYSSEEGILDNCTISGNTADGVYGDGGGIFSLNSNVSISNCTIDHNSTYGHGGGICVTHLGEPVISNCTISFNSADEAGGGIVCGYYCSPTIRNCAVTDNIGVGIVAIYDFDNPVITYCDVYNNSAGNFAGYGIDPDIGVLVGTNANGDPCDAFYNTSLDPVYVDPELGDYHLQANSPCIDTGDPNSPLDPDGTASDIGALYFHQDVGVDDDYTYLADQHPHWTLSPAWPNPFNSNTTIRVELPSPGDLHVTVFNMAGQHVATLANGRFGAGIHELTFAADDLASGIYFIHTTVTNHLNTTQKVVLVR